MQKLWNLSLVGLVALAGCADESKIISPALDGKADVSSAVSMRGGIEIGGEVRAEFDADLQFHGYVFRVGANSDVTLEVTQLGSSASLDSTLLVYQPGPSGFGPAALASDDDSGFAAKSKISGLHLEKQSNYLVVVSTAMGTGRGHYRLTLTCDSGDCTPEPAVDDDGCPDELEDFIRTCVDEQLDDMEEPNRETAFDLCVDSPFAGFGDEPGEVFADLCEFDVPAPDWCALGVDEFVTNFIPTCVELLRPELTEPVGCFEFDAVCLDHPCSDEGLLPVSGGSCDDGEVCCI